jgi:hypothetical protein
VVTSVIDIPVNSPQFDAFIAKFNAYRDALKEQPAVWAEAGDAAASVAVGFAAMSAALLEQNDLFRKQDQMAKDRAKAEKKAADDKKAIDKAQEDRDKAAATRRKAAVEDAKRLAGYVKDTVVDMAKWAALGGLGSLVAGAASMWGLDQFVSSIANERRVSQGLNVTTGEHQALSINMQRYFDVNTALQNVLTGQQDPTSRQRIAMSVLGVNANGDPAQVLGQTAIRARARFIADHENLALANAQGLTDLFSPEDLFRMAKQRPGDIENSYKQAQRDAAPGGRLYLSDEVGRKWQNFLANLDTAGTALQNKLVDKLTVLEKPLELLITRIGNLVLDALNPVNLKALGDGIEGLAHWLGSPKFQADFKTFVDDTSYAASKIVDALRLLGLIPTQSAAQAATTPAGQAQLRADNAKELADEQRKWDAYQTAARAMAGQPGGLVAAALAAGLGPRPTNASLIASDPVYAANAAALAAAAAGGGAIPGGAMGTAPAAAGGGLVTVRAKNGVTFRVAAAYAQKFLGFVNDLEDTGYHVGSVLGYQNRNVAGTNRPSYHAQGLAIDVNPSQNPVGSAGNLPKNVREIAHKWGLGWGEDWTSKKDPMHFSLAAQEGGSVNVSRYGHIATKSVVVAPQPQVRVVISNQTGASVATSVNALQ